MNDLLRRRALVVAGACAAFGALPAKAFPPLRWRVPEQITFIVPFAGGSSPDLVSRILARELSPRLGSTIVVDNRPGAAGNVGMRAVAKAPADGSIIGYGATTSLCINSHLFNSLPYDPQRDFAPVVEFIRARNFVLVPAALPVRSLQELIAYAQEQPAGIFYTSGSVGSTGHLSAELLGQSSHLKMTHVPVQSAQLGLTELAAGRVQLMVDNTTSAVPFIQSGRVRAIAITSLQRVARFPDVPTVAESGFPGFEVEGWGSVVLPAGAPAGAVERLAVEVNASLASPTLRASFAAIGAVPTGGTPEQLTRTIQTESMRWAQVIRTAGITLI